MKATFSIPAVVLMAVILSGCGAKPVAEQKSGDAVMPAEEQSAQNDWVSLLGKGKSIECTLPTGEMTMKMYAEGKKYRTETEIAGKKHFSVSDGKTMWTWAEGEKQGMKMEFSCMDDIRTTIPEEGGPAPEYAASPEEVLGEQRSGMVCVEGGSVDTSVPDDIAFADQCALIRTQLQAMEQMKNQLPQGMPEIPDSAKRMMEQNR
jgi:hypothetical protein